MRLRVVLFLPALVATVVASVIVVSHPRVQSFFAPPADTVKALTAEAEAKASPGGVVHKDIVYDRDLFREYRLDIYEPLPPLSDQGARDRGSTVGDGVLGGTVGDRVPGGTVGDGAANSSRFAAGSLVAEGGAVDGGDGGDGDDGDDGDDGAITDVPKRRTSPPPVIVFFHGGSWIRGDKITILVVDRFLRRMREAGYFVVSVNYTTSLLRGIGGSVQQAQESIHWVAEHADRYGYDAGNIGLYGVSAGGHIALLAASVMEQEGYQFAFAFGECAPTDLIAMKNGNAFDHSGTFRLFPDRRLRRLSPMNRISDSLPPVLLYHGDADQTVHVDQSISYAAALENQDKEVEFVLYPGGDHAFLNYPDELWYDQESRALDYFARKFHGQDLATPHRQPHRQPQ